MGFRDPSPTSRHMTGFGSGFVGRAWKMILIIITGTNVMLLLVMILFLIMIYWTRSSRMRTGGSGGCWGIELVDVRRPGFNGRIQT